MKPPCVSGPGGFLDPEAELQRAIAACMLKVAHLARQIAVWSSHPILIQKPLWFSQGGWFHVGGARHKLVEAKKRDIEHGRLRTGLVAEVQSHKEGTTALSRNRRVVSSIWSERRSAFRVKASPEKSRRSRQRKRRLVRLKTVKAENRARERRSGGNGRRACCGA